MRLEKIWERTTVRGHTNSWKTWPLWNKENLLLSKIVQEMPHRSTRDTEPIDRVLHWAVQSQGQWRSNNTELSPDRHRGLPPNPSQRSGGCSTITEEREVSWSRQHPSRMVKAGEEDVITALTTICDKIWQIGEWPTLWTQSLVITIPKKSSLQRC